MTDAVLSAVDLDACAAEPIRVPGAIQPHGALLVVDPERLARLHASANLAEVAGVALAPGDSLRDEPVCAELVAEVDRWRRAGDPSFLRTVRVGDRLRQVSGHQTPQGLILEFEPPPTSEGQTLEGLYPRLGAFLSKVAAAGDVRAIADVAVREMRVLTGFNRILIYAFDPDNGDGTVLAEDGDGVLPSYRGLRFPASDIPAQARELYRLNRIRLIPNVDYAPSPVTPGVSAVDGQPLDLSYAALRSVSPVHLEYMRNMGTGASMSVSIVVEGRLWGLISAHNRDPRHVNAQVRTACDILGQILSLQIEAREQAERTAERLALREVATELLGKLALAPDYQHGLQSNGRAWMALAHADGAAVITGDKVLSIGATPSADEIRAIATALQRRGEELVATDSMAELWPEAATFAAEASGLLAISISRIHSDYILWFRREVVRTIEWSGDPNKPMEPMVDRLSPRKSFELWKEQVRERSLPWSEAGIESARSFRNAIQDLVLKRAEERAELTSRLERINKELESFSYSISHDLRAPFRHIVGYAELLSERERALDEKSRHYLQSITDAAISAGRLVDDLLHFSQLGRAHLEMGKVDLGKLVAEVRRSLEPDLAGRDIDWRIGPLPMAWGDSAMLRQAFQNLISNAVKYTASRERAEISVSAEVVGERVRCTVADNGVGFDMTYVGKLFGVFQRLHRSEDFEGTGIGLALVKRIVERHGGEVEAWGEVGGGARFTFTVPSRPGLVIGETLRG